MFSLYKSFININICQVYISELLWIINSLIAVCFLPVDYRSLNTHLVPPALSHPTKGRYHQWWWLNCYDDDILFSMTSIVIFINILILCTFKPHWLSINTLSILKSSLIILTIHSVSTSKILYINNNNFKTGLKPVLHSLKSCHFLDGIKS